MTETTPKKMMKRLRFIPAMNIIPKTAETITMVVPKSGWRRRMAAKMPVMQSSSIIGRQLRSRNWLLRWRKAAA